MLQKESDGDLPDPETQYQQRKMGRSSIGSGIYVEPETEGQGRGSSQQAGPACPGEQLPADEAHARHHSGRADESADAYRGIIAQPIQGDGASKSSLPYHGVQNHDDRRKLEGTYPQRYG
jgi:hypothetical protein